MRETQGKVTPQVAEESFNSHLKYHIQLIKENSWGYWFGISKEMKAIHMKMEELMFGKQMFTRL